MKSLIELWKQLANELASWCHTSIALDYKKLRSRAEAEGESFLTITLPTFEKELMLCIERGVVDKQSFPGFHRKDGLPLFLGGFLHQIFSTSGHLLEEPSSDAIFSVRQLCCLFGKIENESSQSREENALRRFIECDDEVGRSEVPAEELYSSFLAAGRLLFSDVYSHVDNLVYAGDIHPKHGPGSTADRLKGNLKYDLKYWPARLEQEFPFLDFAVPNARYSYRIATADFVEPGSEIPVKVITVPKDAKSPRIIAIEPTAMQYAQQSLLLPLVEALESSRLPGFSRDNLCFGFLGFSDQVPNRALARIGSLDRSLATIDLSEASDRVHALHVWNLLRNTPHLQRAVFACRSQKAEVLINGDSEIVHLNKFASMGSALCFPFEAMVFLAIVFAGIAEELKMPLTRNFIMKYRGKIRIYGDDIIVPAEFVSPVRHALHSFGMKCNVNKTFSRSNFRESCGGDYWKGIDVTPIRFRRHFPTALADVSEIVSLVSFSNQLYLRGLWRTSSYVDDFLSKLLKGRYPVVGSDSPALGRFSFMGYIPEKYSLHTFTPMVKAYSVYAPPPRSIATGEGSLMKVLLPGRELPFQDPRHLTHQGRPSVVGIKLKWVPAY